MGEIANAVINGDMCELCGVYLGEGDGYPRLCNDCKCGHPPEQIIFLLRGKQCGKCGKQNYGKGWV